MTDSKHYLELADEADRKARLAPTDEIRDIYRKLAEGWRNIAASTARVEGIWLPRPPE